MKPAQRPTLTACCLLALTTLIAAGQAIQDLDREAAPQVAEAASSPRFRARDQKEALTGTGGFDSILKGLDWLVKHQSPAGSWNVDGENKAPSVDATALALLALVGDGNTTRLGNHRRAVADAADWLLANETDWNTTRAQGISLYALAELRRFDPDAVTQEALHRRLDALLAARTREGVWNATENGPADAIVSSWCTAAVVATRDEGLEAEFGHLEAIGSWFEGLVDDTGKVTLETPSGAIEHGTAVCLLPRMILGQDVEQARRLKLQADRLTRDPAKPNWEQDDLEYWYAATTGLQLVGGAGAEKWYENVRQMFLDNQFRGGSAAGSWQTVGYAPERGRVRSTAMALLTLQAPYRVLVEKSSAGTETPVEEERGSGEAGDSDFEESGERGGAREACAFASTPDWHHDTYAICRMCGKAGESRGPIGPWGFSGGPDRAKALLKLTLEVCTRRPGLAHGK